jgi:hypothetical protein
MSCLAEHVDGLERELAWVAQVIDVAFRLYFGQDGAPGSIDEIAPPMCIAPPGFVAGTGVAPPSYGATVLEYGLGPQERLVLMLALIPHVRPQMLDLFLMKNEQVGRPFTEFGGAGGDGHGCFLPTVETAAFILAGAGLERRLALHALFDPKGKLLEHRLIELGPGRGASGLFGHTITISAERLGLLTRGAAYRPSLDASFPARRISTELEWQELVLDADVLHDVEEIRAWIEHGQVLLEDWKLQRQIKPGFRSLFYGPPGTGKTLTAALLGKVTHREVYRVDLSMVVSKYIGETEKNLAGLFDQAACRDWILFFDEADALFGKRSQASSANDRHANQEVAYLLQRIEDFPGVVILASNLKGNIDEAFARRFQSMVFFPTPKPAQRLALWRHAFADPARLDPEVDLAQIAAEFELSGGAIINVLRFASLMCLRRGAARVGACDIRHGIKRELWKDGKVA